MRDCDAAALAITRLKRPESCAEHSNAPDDAKALRSKVAMLSRELAALTQERDLLMDFVLGDKSSAAGPAAALAERLASGQYAHSSSPQRRRLMNSMSAGALLCSTMRFGSLQFLPLPATRSLRLILPCLALEQSLRGTHDALLGFARMQMRHLSAVRSRGGPLQGQRSIQRLCLSRCRRPWTRSTIELCATRRHSHESREVLTM